MIYGALLSLLLCAHHTHAAGASLTKAMREASKHGLLKAQIKGVPDISVLNPNNFGHDHEHHVAEDTDNADVEAADLATDGGKGSSSSSTPPNFIVFTIDDTFWPEQWSESAPRGVDLEGGKPVLYEPYPTPLIDEFRDEAVIFPKTYCGGPKCAPSRYSVLTGRQPTRCAHAIKYTLERSDGYEGTNVSIPTMKLWGDDSEHNIPYTLQQNGYYTAMIGKWHIMDDTDNGADLQCAQLIKEAHPELYGPCTDVVKAQGFDYVDSFYIGNIVNNEEFSHNPEWMISQAQKAIEASLKEEKPFYLYLATTLTHAPDMELATQEFTYYDSPKGQLTGEDVPDDTTMLERIDLWEIAKSINVINSRSVQKTKNYVKYWWVDDQFGALVNFLKHKEIYDNTMVVFINDHGMEAKGTVFEQGSRIMQFVRYPPMFGTDGAVMPSDYVTSNVDIGATILDLADVDAEYELDGVSYVADVVQQLEDPDPARPSECCEYRFVDIYFSHALFSGRYQYVFRANTMVDTAKGVDLLYPYFYDLEQLYDLDEDPNCKTNLIDDYDYAAVVDRFERKMREYLVDICIAEDGECAMPELKYDGYDALPDEPESTFTTPSPTTPFPTTPTPTTPAPVRRGGGSSGSSRGGGSSSRGNGGSSGSGKSNGGGYSGGGGRGGGDEEEEEFVVVKDVKGVEGYTYDVHANLGLTVAAIMVLGVLGCLMRHRCVAQKKMEESSSVSYGAVSASQ